MSPWISREPLMQPSQDPFLGAFAGTTSATGFPKRVIRTGLPVRLTSSSTARHVALNLEIAISRISNLYHSGAMVQDWIMKVAFVGLGNMGAPMARNLLRAGHQLTVYN